MSQVMTQVMKDRWRQHKLKLQRAQEREARRAERQYFLVSHCSPKPQADPMEAPQNLPPDGQPYRAKQTVPLEHALPTRPCIHSVPLGSACGVSKCLWIQ